MFLDKRYGQSFPSGLTVMPDKAALYSLDPHFWEGWEDFVGAVGHGAAELARGHSLVLVRPDAVASRKAHLVIDWLSGHGFRLVACVPLQIDRHQVRSLWHYQWNVALRERRDACDALMGVCPSMLLVMADERPSALPATQRFSTLKGASDPALRRPGDLRAELGHKSRMLSLVHSPDEAADFVREIAIFLPEPERKALFARMGSGAVLPTAEAKAQVLAIYRDVPEHNLDLNESVARVLALANETMGPAGTAGPLQAERQAVAALADRIARGQRTDWRQFFRPLDRCQVTYAPWDRVVIAGHLAAMDAEGKRVLIDRPPREAASNPLSTPGTGVLVDQRFGSPIEGGLTEMADKAALYSVDTYFREGWEDLVSVTGESAAAVAFSHSIMLVKPDALVSGRLDVVLGWLPRLGFSVVASMPVAVCADQTKALWRYQWNCAPRIRKDAYVAMFKACASLLLVVRSTREPQVSAAKRLANLKGPADPVLQRPDDLRAWLGNATHLLSFVHAADEPADVVRELAILLPPAQRMAVHARMRDGLELSTQELRAEAARALQGLTKHSLDVHKALGRVEGAVLDACGMDTADRETAAALCASARNGAGADWRVLFGLLDRWAIRYDPWDRITIAAHTSDVSNPHLEALLPGAIPLARQA